MATLTGHQSYRALVAQVCLDVVLQLCSLPLSLPVWVISEVGIPRAKYHSYSSSCHFYKLFLFLIFTENTVLEFKTQFIIKFNFQSISYPAGETKYTRHIRIHDKPYAAIFHAEPTESDEPYCFWEKELPTQSPTCRMTDPYVHHLVSLP
jgi:hypothetical protein